MGARDIRAPGARSPARRRRATSGRDETVARLRERLREAEETLEAIRQGHVDALVIQGPSGEQVFTLIGADHRYRQLVETMNEGALLLGADGTIVYGNARFAALAELPLERMIGARLHDLVPVAHHPLLDAVLRGRGGASSKAEVELATASGGRVPIYLSATASWGDDDALTCVIATDLTEQKRNLAMVAAERLAALIVEQAAEGIVVCDPDGLVIRASGAAHRAAGGNPLLRPFVEAFPLADGRRPVAEELLAAALRGETINGREVTLPREGRDAVELLLSAGPILADNGVPLGCVVSFVDVTERRRAAEERLHILEGAQEARIEAERANRAKDEFLAMLGHELRNPLSPVLTALEIMRMKEGQDVVREREIIERQVHVMVRLVDDLLDVARIAQGKIALDRSVIEVGDIVRHAIDVASPLIDEHQHRLEVDLAPALGVVGDEMRLCQVVANLLTNAAKYTPRGGRIRVTAFADDGEIVLRVTDNGAGIPPEILPQLFDRFVQGRRTIDRSEGGLGLGLAIVRNLVTMHGGIVSARSEGVGKGAEFEIRLPALPRNTESARPAIAPAVAAPNGTRRVLIVDDNVDIADLLAEALSALGHDARVAYDGPAALAMATAFEPDIAFVDIGLPVMDGFELAGRLREASGERPLRLIAVTGYGQDSDRDRSAAAGFDLHLVKPIQLATLTALIDATPPS
ncbi:MAG TPA: ATP-binding protein [Kofleriaceae bacterium]|nr:ATP-binding protein [Kofleriaceae bacterium]